MKLAAPQDDSLGRGLLRSLVLHLAVGGAGLGWGMWNFAAVDRWGDPNAMPGAGFAVTPVDRIPLPTRQSRPNPKADDSESEVEKAEQKDRDRDRVRDDPDAVALKSDRDQKKNDQQTSRYKYRSSTDIQKESLRTTVAQSVSNPMFGSVGAGGVGVGTGTPFGNRFGAYADLVRRRIAEKWRTNDVDAGARSAKPAIVSFDILRNGTVRNIKIVESSGLASLDFSARRAVTEASPLPELPREFERDFANVEFTFQLQR
ncbi:MAG: TonB C-terminal domain-containing protein [Acidobacteria bacterium]|nr:TonB C-terminal domain-containing protein [Acidobacteriota bacterium]